MDGPESRARSMDTDEGTFETLETASSSPRRPLSIVQETYVDESVTVIDGKGIPSKPPSTMPLEAEQPPPSAQASDATSTRSLPALEISRSQTPVGSVESSTATSAVAPPSPARSRHSTNDENPSSRDAPRTINRRSTIDVSFETYISSCAAFDIIHFLDYRCATIVCQVSSIISSIEEEAKSQRHLVQPREQHPEHRHLPPERNHHHEHPLRYRLLDLLPRHLCYLLPLYRTLVFRFQPSPPS
jgi:hypothetical protein